jgi:hypothetical protein
MNEFNGWMQSNWYALGNLLAQFAFLAAGLWFARKILRAMRASQEQFGALLKLSLTDELRQPAKSATAAQPITSSMSAERPTPYVMAEWPAAAEAPALTLPAEKHRSRHLGDACKGLLRWLQTPMSHHGLVSWRKIAHWLQAPAGS